MTYTRQDLFDLYNKGFLSTQSILDLFNINPNCPVCGVNLINNPNHLLNQIDLDHIVYMIHDS